MGKQVRLLVGTGKGAFFYTSDEGRRNWKVAGPYLHGWSVYSLHGENTPGKRVFAGTGHYVYGATIRYTDDLGETWTQVENGPTYSPDSGFALKQIWQIVPGHSSEPGTLYAGVDEAGLFVSRDGGTNWSEVSALTQHPTRPNWMPGNGGLCLHTILVDPINPKRIWVAISAVGVFRTEDGGDTWALCNSGLPGIPTGSRDEDVCHCVHKIVLDPLNSDTLYMQFHGGVLRSTNGATSWQAIEHGLPGNFGFPMAVTRAGNLFIAPLEDEPRTFFDGRMRVFRSANGGTDWSPLDKGLPGEPSYVGVLRDAMDADGLEPAGVYFGTTMGELFYSASNGDEWERLPGFLPRIHTVKAWVDG